MQLFTTEIEQQLQAQFKMGSSLEQKVICKIFNPYGAGTWYVMNQDPDDPDYLWGIADIWEPEMGSFSKKELENLCINISGLEFNLERDLYWEPKIASHVWDELHGMDIKRGSTNSKE